MRDIKFRGYNEINKKMLNWNELLYTNLKNIFTMQKKDTGIILMQYTGLHDKNGKEIYEGDIVGDKDIKWVIKWNLHRMGFSLYPTNEQLYDEMPINVENKLGFEILGNIYDNPDLLEKGVENEC